MSVETSVGAHLQEALVMASMVSLRDDLAVDLGDAWAFNWKTNVITIPRRELEECPGERIAWIILHEAAHAALTRFHDILPDELLKRPEVHLLLNVIEDLRIEEWLVERFPGSRAWRAVCRAGEAAEAAEAAEAIGTAVEDAATHAQAGNEITAAERSRFMSEFLRGLFALGEGSPVSPGTSPRVGEALEHVREPLARALACRPPVNTAGNEAIAHLYSRHPVSVCYRYRDALVEPDSFEKWVRVMQLSTWQHIVEGILPVYLRLLNLPRTGGIQLREVLQRISGTQQGRKRSPEEVQRDLRRQLAALHSAPYRKVVQDHQFEIERVSRILEELLPNHRGLRHRRGFGLGDRIDLQLASQSEADPRLYDKLWMKRIRRTLPDPAFVFVMDRSGSMKPTSRSGAAFASLVMVREACTRNRIPFAVIAFNEAPVLIHDWERLNDERAQAALGVILKPEGGTDLVQALENAEQLIAQRPERDRFVFVLTDGNVPEEQSGTVRSTKKRMEETGVHFAAIGLSVAPQEFQSIFPGAPVLNAPSELPRVFGDLLILTQTEAA